MTAYPLRTLQARLQKVMKVTSEEIETEGGDIAGKYVFRDKDGEKYMWSPRPYAFHFHDVEVLAEAHHVMFLCPLCFEKNGGSKGTHSVMVTFAGRDVPDEVGSRDSTGKPSRWTIVSGSGLDDLVLTPSILLNASQKPEVGCHWHGFVGSSGIPTGHAG